MSTRTRTPRPVLRAAASLLGLVAALSFATGSVAAAAPASVAVGTASTALGSVLVGASGMTLYTLSSDPNKGSVCTGQCLVFWPPLLVTPGGAVTASPGISGTLATFVRADDGTTQVTDDGRALYYFKNDTAPGQTNGEGIKGAGGVWHAALATAAAAPSPTPVASQPAAVPVAATPATGTTPPPTSTQASGDAPTTGVPLGILVFASAASIGLLHLRRRLAPVPHR